MGDAALSVQAVSNSNRICDRTNIKCRYVVCRDFYCHTHVTTIADVVKCERHIASCMLH